MLEGLSSTGKTTNARFIHLQLQRHEICSKWIHEIAVPHPVLFFTEAGLTHEEYSLFLTEHPDAEAILADMAVFRESTVGIDLTELQWRYDDEDGQRVYQALLAYEVWNYPTEVYSKFALEKWQHFTSEALKHPEEVYIIDSAIYQYQIYSYLLRNRPFPELLSFVQKITEIVQPLNPCLIFLRREDTEATIDYLEKIRGTSYLEYIWQRDNDQPYYMGRPTGAEGYKEFLRDYAVIADMLCEAFPSHKMVLDITEENWTCLEDQMLSFLDISRIPDPVAYPQDGIYVNAEFGFIIRVEGMSITDPREQIRPLHLKSPNEFYVDWIPTVLCFEENSIVISGSQTGSRWTTTGLVFEKQTERT